MNYSNNPENVDEIIEQIKNSPNIGEIKKIFDNYYPNFIKNIFDNYSDDYPNLKSNWDTICKKCNTTPKKIILVEEINLVDFKNNKLINIYNEILTRVGFCVRKEKDFIGCKVCNKAIPCIELYNILKVNGNYIPNKWSNICSKCM